jgi:ribosomal protein S18 acetylase RimI-like enzyme
LDVRRDLGDVADLIEIAFSSQMDPDGKEYLRQLRRMARDTQWLQWANGLIDRAPIPVSGYVWEEGGRVVGNLSLIQVNQRGVRTYLIANVAVHPDYRRKGIGKALTQAAVDHARRHGSQTARLQVREDNPGALRLYQDLGFVEVARRSTWLNHPDAPALQQEAHAGGQEAQAVVTARYSRDWPQQVRWLQLLYPPQISWNFPINLGTLKPGFWHTFIRLMDGDLVRHWAARRQGQLIGVVTWCPSRSSSDYLWIAAGLEFEEEAIHTLLPAAVRKLPRNRSLTINYPAGRAVQALEAAGFHNSHTLIWMEKDLTRIR